LGVLNICQSPRQFDAVAADAQRVAVGEDFLRRRLGRVVVAQ
jgi:hypothetical protein